MKITTLDVAGFRPALTAMRHPFESYARSDSVWHDTSDIYPDEPFHTVIDFMVGKADRDLSERLAKAGPEHAKHLRMIMVWADIAAPLYWWKQMDCYRAGVEKLSTSTMHTLLRQPFDSSNFEVADLPGYKYEPKQFVPDIDEENEKWVEYFGYKVSNQGRVFGRGGKEVRGVLHRDGYRFMWFDGKIVPMHRIIATCFCDGYQDGLVIDHVDGNKQNNKAENLEWVTQKENIRRSRDNHQQPNQTNMYDGKLTKEQREEVIRLAGSGKYSRREIGRMFGVSHSCICSIVNHKYEYAGKIPNVYELVVKPTINELNRLRERYFEEEDADTKATIWKTIVSLLPESFIQKRTVMFSYAALRNIYRQRTGHKLHEWRSFLDWVETLPESWMITGKGVPGTEENG